MLYKGTTNRFSVKECLLCMGFKYRKRLSLLRCEV